MLSGTSGLCLTDTESEACSCSTPHTSLHGPRLCRGLRGRSCALPSIASSMSDMCLLERALATDCCLQPLSFQVPSSSLAVSQGPRKEPVL